MQSEEIPEASNIRSIIEERDKIYITSLFKMFLSVGL